MFSALFKNPYESIYFGWILMGAFIGISFVTVVLLSTNSALPPQVAFNAAWGQNVLYVVAFALIGTLLGAVVGDARSDHLEFMNQRGR
jgi:hypothetical protein